MKHAVHAACCALTGVNMGNARSFGGGSRDGAVVWRDKSRVERAIEEEKGLSLCDSSASFAPLLVLDVVTHLCTML